MSLLELLIAGVMKLAGGQMFPVLVPRAQRLSQIRKGFAESGGQYIVPVLMVTAVLLAASMVFVILNSHREKARLRDQEKKYFRHRMIEKELEPGHIRMLSDAVSITGFLRPDRVLDSFETFKHLIAEYEKAQTLSKQEHDYLMKTVNEIKGKLGFDELEKNMEIGSTREISKGQRIHVILKKDGRRSVYPSCVSYINDDHLVIDSSEIDPDNDPLDIGSAIEVRFCRENDAGYDFTTTLSAPPDHDNNLLYLKHSDRLKRRQGREYTRMDAPFKFSFYHLPKAEYESTKSPPDLMQCRYIPVFLGDSVNISGGGLAFKSRKNIEEGDYLFIKFKMLEDREMEPVLAEVVWAENGDEKLRKVKGVRFNNLLDKMREQLTGLVFQIQRRNARKNKYMPKQK